MANPKKFLSKNQKTLPEAGSFSLGQTLEVQIDRLAYHSGDGVGRHNGFVIFVPNTCPGDKALVKLTEIHAHFAKATLEQILVSSPNRREPPCPVALACGGCHWQHVEYSTQLIQKDHILKSALKKWIDPSSEKWLPLIYGNEFHYRNRIQIQKKDKKLGFFSSGTRQIVEFDQCLIAEHQINKALLTQRKVLLESEASRIEIARAQDQSIQIRTPNKDPEQLLFSQVNEFINQKMVDHVLELSRSQAWTKIVELYCGSGNFTFQINQAHPKTHLTAVEMSQRMVELAKKRQSEVAPNASIDWIASSTEDFLKDFCPKMSEWLLVLDPPRPGCDRFTRDWILEKRPHQIIYVSCNPSTLARDIEHWLKDGLYQIQSARGFDMFPQTAHIEAVVSLIAKKL